VNARAGILPLVVLAAVAVGQQPRSPAVEVAEQFLHAFRRDDRSAQAILAARPPSAVSYTLAVQTLLDSGETEVAAALAQQRGGPEHEGLLRLVEVWRSGQRPTSAQGAALQAAARALEQEDGQRALDALAGAGEPVPGTLFAVRILWSRAHALRLLGRAGEALDAFLDCSDLAVGIGWWAQARDAADAALRTPAGEGPDERARRAADRLVEAARKLQEGDRLLAALVRRSGVLRSLGAGKEARADLVEAISVAQSLGKPLEEAQIQGNLALMLQVEEGQPRASLRHHEAAVRLLRGLDRPDALAQALFNYATALTATARYADALSALDEALALAANGEHIPRTPLLAQRAYVQRRMGRVRTSLADYEEALARAPTEKERIGIELDLADLQLERGDPAAAEARYLDVLERRPADARALAGRAFCLGMRGDEGGARSGFEAAADAAGSDVERARLLMPLLALERAWGDLGGALEHGKRILRLFLDHPGEDHGNTAVAYGLVGDILLLGGHPEEALDFLARASVYFQRLRDPARALPAYARETLVLYSLGKGEEAVERASWLREMAKAVHQPGPQSASAVVDAILSHGAGLDDQARGHMDRALELARESGDPVREATALVARAWLWPEHAIEDIPTAFALLDALRTRDVEKQPALIGEDPWNAAAVGIASLLRAGDLDEDARAGLLLRWIERDRAEQVRLGFGGRDSLLHATLPEPLHAAWVEARAALLEARATGGETAEAEAAFDSFVARLRDEEPAIAALAYPQPMDLARVQAVLAKDEALLLYHDGPFGRTLLVVDSDGAQPFAYDPQRPLDAAAARLEGRRLLLVSPDGPLAALSFEAAPFGQGTAGETFALAHVPSASWLVRQRTAKPPEGAAGPWARVPQDATALLSRGRVTLGATGALGLLAAPGARPPLVVPGLRVVPGDRPRIGALATLVEALSRAGPGPLLLSLDGSEPLQSAAADDSLPPAEAWRRAVRKARGGESGGVPVWARAVLYSAR